MDDFLDDVVHLTCGGKIFKGTLVRALVMIGMDHGPWEECDLKELQDRFLDMKENLSFNVKVDMGENHFTVWLSIGPYSFIPREKGEEDLDIRFDFLNDQRLTEISESNHKMYPPAVDDKINGKEIKCIEAFECPCIRSPVKRRCVHNVYIDFKDGTHIAYWRGGPEVSADFLRQNGYIPYIKQFLPDTETDTKIQMEFCKLSRMIVSLPGGHDKLKKFVRVWPPEKTKDSVKTDTKLTKN